VEQALAMKIRRRRGARSSVPRQCVEDGRMSGWLTARSGALLLTRERYYFRFRWGFLSQYLTEHSSALQRFCMHAASISLHSETRKILIGINPPGMLGAHGAGTSSENIKEQDCFGARVSGPRTSSQGGISENYPRQNGLVEGISDGAFIGCAGTERRRAGSIARPSFSHRRIVLIADTDEEFQAWGSVLERAHIRNIAQCYRGQTSLGNGASGDVILVSSLRNPDELAAVKRIEYRKSAQSSVTRQLRRIQQEIQIQHKASSHCKTSVRVYDVFFDNVYVYVVMEYVSGGTLSQWLSLQESETPEGVVISIIQQLTKCIMLLHQHKIVHRDIKADNCLLELDSNGVPVQIRLVDFGFAELYRGEYGTNMANFCSGFLGTASYMAPEICSFEQYGAPVDLFALGVIVHLLLMKAYPFESESLLETLELVKHGRTCALSSNFDISPDAKSFCLSLLNKNPKKRLTAAGALQHRWIRHGHDVTRNVLRSADTDRSPRAWFRRIVLVISVCIALRNWSVEPVMRRAPIALETLRARAAMLERLDNQASAGRRRVFRRVSSDLSQEEQARSADPSPVAMTVRRPPEIESDSE
jgi:serine/threonine protein kinase